MEEKNKMSHEHTSDSSRTHIPLNETVRLAKYIVSLFSAGADPAARSPISSPESLFNSSHDEHLYNLLNNPKLKKDEAIIHMYILFVLFCYVIGTGLIVMKYIKRESSLHQFNSSPTTRAISFTHMDSSEVWIKSTATSCETLSENYGEDDDSLSVASERLHLSSNSDVTYV